MKILVHDYTGHPFQVQLSRVLAQRGYEVLHLYSGDYITPRGEVEKRNTDPKNLRINPIFMKTPTTKYNFFKRWFQENEYGHVLAKETLEFQPNIVIASNTPLDALRHLQTAARKTSSFFVFWLQDIYGLATSWILTKKYPVLGAFIGKYYTHLEKQLLGKSDAIVEITEDFQPVLQAWKISSKKLITIPNWAPLDSIPVVEKYNPWTIQHHLEDFFVAIYSGTLGLKHNPGILIHAAKYLSKYPDFRLVVISEGLGAKYIKKSLDETPLENLLLIGFQPFEVLPNVLGASNVLLALLEPEAGAFSVPSKVLTSLCAGRPILLSCPAQNLAARIISENEAGIVTKPGDPDQFAKELEKLYLNRNLREKYGKNARQYSENNFDIESITTKFEDIWQSAK
jgi:colanic acid biosynthesis glycosyl transferase WcaI